MEKIRQLEKQTSATRTKKATWVPMKKGIHADPTFQRDYNALLERLGYDSEIASHSEHVESQDETATCSSMSISLESILARKDAVSRKAKIATDSLHTRASDLQQFDLTSTNILYDLVRHFVLLRKVHDLVVKPRCNNNISNIFVPKLERKHNHDENSVHSDMMSANAVILARKKAEKLQGDKLKHIV